MSDSSTNISTGRLMLEVGGWVDGCSVIDRHTIILRTFCDRDILSDGHCHFQPLFNLFKASLDSLGQSEEEAEEEADLFPPR